MLVSTRVIRISMAPLARIERELISSVVKLMCVPVICTVVWRALVMSVLRTNVHLFLWNTFL